MEKSAITSGISGNTWRYAQEVAREIVKARKRVKRFATTGDEVTVKEAVNVTSAMWVGKTLLVLQTNPQETHSAATVLHVTSWLEAGVTLSTTCPTGTKMDRGASGEPDNRLDRGGGSRTKDPYVGSKATATRSQIAQIFTTWRIFPNSADPKDSEKPTEGETTETNRDNPHEQNKH